MKESEDPQVSQNENTQFEREHPFAAVSAGALPESLRAEIARQPFLAGFSPRHLEQLAESALLMEFETGQPIFREGEPANRFFIILKGKVALESDGAEGSTIPIQTLGPGQDLGWSWLFLPHSLHFSAHAIEPTKLLFFYGVHLREKCEEDHDLGYELMKRVGRVVVQRLESTQRKLAECTGVKNYQD
jgi:CRP/FNR family cyclic AMP-dependent transcriptional regulator